MTTTCPKLYIKRGVYYLSEYKKSEFEKIYLKIREKENRIYDDATLKTLPDIKTSHPLYDEWKIRKKSMQKIIAYLINKDRILNILEVGCGNGWLTHHLAMIKNSYVVGVDINKFELEQAARVFNNFSNHKFFYADIFADSFDLGDFDIIVLPNSIRYFANITYLIERLLCLTKRNGEIHIINSPIYNPSEIQKAQKQTLKYYEKIGCCGMSEFHFHHSIEDLRIYNPVFLNKQIKQNFYSWFFKDDSPFPWIMIKNSF
jgi:ubiquinone/menaquinone biosynthesis C-methylase UbiE